jgi:uncharacterized protein involved in outer membrane biogenesis
MKKTLYGLAVLFSLGGIGVYLAFNYIDVIVRVALEHWGPDVTGVSVKVGEIEISPRDGRGSIRGLEIGSPNGFTAPRAVRFGEIRVSLDPSTLTDRVIVIRSLTLDAPQITYEKGAKAANLDVIQDQIEAYVKRSGATSSIWGKYAPSYRRKFIIERLNIRHGRVTMTNSGLKGQGLNFDLPDVELTDVGRRQDGVTASEAAAIVASTLQVKIAQKVLTNIELLRKGGIEGAVDALKGLLK